MKPSLTLRQTQRLAITPQLRQALGLLQLSALELQDALREALEQNMLLEKIEDAEEPAGGSGPDQAVTGIRRTDATEKQMPTPDDTVQADWDSTELASGWSETNDTDSRESAALADESLRQHLLWQLGLSRLGPRDAAIGALLIDSLNDDGYLTASLEELRLAFDDAGNAPDGEEMQAVLHRLQSFDPPGVGARDLRECLSLQLRQLDAATPGRELALRLVDAHLDELAAHAHARLCRVLAADAAALQQAIVLIQSLNPRPGTTLTSSAVDFIVPDVLVSRRDGRWLVELNPDTVPRLRVNAAYAAALGRRRNGENADLGRQLQEARWLVKCLKMRNQTLLRVAECLVRHQAAFLSEGEEAMRPLMLKDVAAELELHESTISRVVANKYLATPRGTLAFRHFFSNEMSTDSGDGLSATAIRALIRKLVAQEDPRDPLSDDHITRELVSRGIRVARRTVAKYRESMAIPPAHGRKRLATR